MLIQFSMILLASQLVVAVADDVPKFDIARGCKIDSAAAAGMSGTIKRCVDDEQGDRIMLLFAAVRESGIGTKRSWR